MVAQQSSCYKLQLIIETLFDIVGPSSKICRLIGRSQQYHTLQRGIKICRSYGQLSSYNDKLLKYIQLLIINNNNGVPP